MKRIVAAAVLLGTAASAADAADLAMRPVYTKAPVMAAVYDWTGFYLGVNAGVGVGRTRTTHNIAGPDATDTFYQQAQGGFGGGQIGYNWQTSSSFLGLGPLLLGLEADIQGGSLRDNQASLVSLNFVSNFNQQIDWFATARGRVGIVTGPTVTYVTGGYAYGNVRNTITETPVPAAPGAIVQLDRGQGGYVLGSGVEAALGGNWTGKIEYLYLNLGSRNDAFTALGTAQTLNTRVREDIFRVGLNYKIGGRGLMAPVSAANWTGFYLGGNVGSGLARNPTVLSNPGVAGAIPERFNLAPDGYTGGAQLGYNWQASSNWVFGLEGDYQGSTQRDNRTCVQFCNLNPAIGSLGSYDAKLPWFATARGRLGYAVGPSLFYVTGGYAVGEVKTATTISSLVPPAPLFSQTFSSSQTRSGYAVGAGIETPFTLLGLFGPNWTTKTEYLYVDLGSTTSNFVFGTVAAGNLTPFSQTTRVNEHVFRTGLNYHFNSPVVAKY